MSQEFPTEELLGHCADLVEGQFDESRAARLRALLRDDPGAREFYLRFMEVHALLHLDYAGGSTPATMPGGSSMPLASLTMPALGDDLFEGPALGFETLGSPGLASARSLAVAFGFGMAAMLLLVGLSWGVLDRGRPGNPAGAIAARGRDRARPESAVARVITLDDARWDPAENRNPKVGDMIEAGPFRLRSGGVTLGFLGGVVLSLDGPADLDLVAIDRIFCRRGRLRARVPQRAEGFVVASPRSGVSTIGTDFVLDVDPDGRARIQAYEGAAEAALRDDRRGQVAGSQAGERIAAADPGPGSPLDLAPAYPALVRDSRPIGYWRFNSLERDGVPNEVAGAPALRLIGAARTQESPRGNRYLVLPADRGEPFLETDSWPLPQTPDHSVEFWFLAEARRHASLVGLLPARGLSPIGQDDLYLHPLLVELTASQRQSTHKPSSVRLLLRSPAEPLRVDNVYSAQAYVPGRWHHVVAQTRGDSAELYLDGVLTGASRVNPGKAPSLCQVVVGRRTPDPGDQNESRAFEGCLDELALYDHALDPAEIRGRLQAVDAPNAGR